VNSFIEHLMELEQNISFDPETDTPADLVAKAKQSYKIAAGSPERAIRARQQAIGDREKELRGDKEDPLARERLQITKLEQQIARLKMNLARKESMASKKGAQV